MVKGWLIAIAAVLAGSASAAAQTEPVIGKAIDGQLSFIPPGSDMSADLIWFHNGYLLPIITVISLFVLGLLAYVMVKFNAKANPTPTRTTHNTMVEVVWTVVPILILIAIAIPSFRLLSEQVRIPQIVEMKDASGAPIIKADGAPQMGIVLGGRSDASEAMPITRVVNLKATGNEWNWTYNYAEDSGGLEFISNMLREDAYVDEATTPRLLAVDNEVVVPVNAFVRIQVTSSRVNHAFALPSFGIKIDAIPGRLNEGWFRPEKIGVYYGQCSELCGKDHAFMPIAVRVVSEAQYDRWLDAAKGSRGRPGIARDYMIASINEMRALAAAPAAAEVR